MAKKHTENPLSQSFRRLAGLPERKSDEPHDVDTPSDLTRAYEPEGGYGGRGETPEPEATDEKSSESGEKKKPAKKAASSSS